MDCKRNIGELTVTTKLEGYDTIKLQLNDIEQQLDRILDKQKLAGYKTDIEKLADELYMYMKRKPNIGNR